MGKDLKGKELGEGLCQIKDGRYVGRYTDRYGKRKTIYGKNLKEVRDRFGRALYSENIYDEGVKCTDITVDELYSQWIEYKCGKVKPSTLGAYENQYYNAAKEQIGEIKLSRVDARLLQRVFDELAKRCYASTLVTYRATLSNMFSYAVKHGYITKNPVSDVVIEKKQRDIVRSIEKRDNKFLSQDQVSRLMRFAEEHNRKNIILYKLILLTGLRCGEAIALTWNDIDFERRIIRVSKTFSKVTSHNMKSKTYTQTPKTQSSVRDVPMCESVVKLLKEQLMQRRTENDFVFVNGWGEPYKGTSITVVFRNLIKSYNKYEADEAAKEHRNPNLIPENSLHALRHTFATRCFENDISPKIVQRYMGHSNINMTMNLYTHVSNEKLLFDIEKINHTV